MIQLRVIREYTPRGSNVSKKFDAPLDPDIKTTDLKELFLKLPDIIEQIPKDERYNVFYTLGHMPENSDGKNRQWSWQEVIPFDIDDIEVEDDTVNPKYLEAISDALSVDLNKCVTMFSGNGLQVLIRPNFKITDAKWFKHNEIYYQTLVSKVNDKLFEYGLKGEADPSAFAPNRLFRVPLTFNKKPGRPLRQARLLTASIDPIEYDLKLASGLPDVAEDDALSEKQLSYFDFYTSNVLSACNFLKDMKDHPQNITEPQWYAGLSILARLDNGEGLCHEYSKGHPSYHARETDRKIQQSLRASGPRTCDNIDKLWGKCRQCPNYKKVPSPIALKGENFIATRNTGFHLLRGKAKLIPQYEDLRRFYDEKYHYINIAQAHYRWRDSYYQYVGREWISNFANENFNPVADNTKRSEFRGLVESTNLKDPNFFQDSTDRLINLSNGVLNIDTMTLEDHSPQYGFKYKLPFDYDPIAEAPLFKHFLNGVTCNDPTLQATLLEFMGFILSNESPRVNPKVLIMPGEGQNGKSTFIRVLRHLCGDGVVAISAQQLNKQFFAQKLDGSVLCVMEEVPAFTNTQFWEDLKNVAAGGAVTDSLKGKDVYTFSNKAKFVLTANKLPKGATPSHGFYRRLLIVPFNAQFSASTDDPKVKEDKFIGEKIIQHELPGVLNMVLEAYHRFRANNYEYTQSNAVDQALEEYKIESDNVVRWTHEHIVTPPDEHDPKPKWVIKDIDAMPCLSVNAMYKDYVLWVENEGEKPVSRPHFSRRLISFLEKINRDSLSLRRRRIDGERDRILYGVSWISSWRY